jgi:hypothetical protein
MGGGRFRFMATDPDGITGSGDEPSLDDIQRLYHRVAHVPATLYGLNWSSRFRINSRHMTTLRAGCVFFGGDAAHVHSPAGGQGMNAGIQDMVNLSWKIAMVLDGRARQELLDTYETDRLPVIRQLVRMTERATTVFNSTRPIVHAALTRLAPSVLRPRCGSEQSRAELGQLAASYRGRPIARGGGHIGELRAGDRVPDIEVTTDTGVRTRLYDLLDLGALTLFAGDSDHRAAEVCLPWTGIVTVRPVSELPFGPGWLLVRPDGYVAAAGGPKNAGTLSRWLDRWFTSLRR